MSKKVRLLVTIDLPTQVSKSSARNYVVEAIQTWRGQTRPPGSYGENDDGDPWWHLNPNKMTVKHIR